MLNFQEMNIFICIFLTFIPSKKERKLTITIYGEGILRNFLTKLISFLNLEDRIFLPGIATEVETVLTSADLFVFPSIYEGFPNALCEAMSCGLPVIASNCSGNIDIVEEGVNGLLFNVADVDGLVSCIKKLLDNSDYANKLAVNAQDVVNKFSEPEILKLWDNVLHQAICKLTLVGNT